MKRLNQEQLATKEYLETQVQLGLKPKYMVTFHYSNSAERCWRTIEKHKPMGFRNRIGFKCRDGFWHEVEADRSLDRQRNDYDCITNDAAHIKNTILKYLYGIKRLNQTWRHDYPQLLFFHEKGKVNLQYHTHLLMPEENLKINDTNGLRDYFHSNLRRKSKCLTKWKSIDVREVTSVNGILSYLNKETSKFHNSLDYINSNPIIREKP